MNNDHPRVTVVVPAFNQAPFLAETLESVRRQTFGDWECIVVDDGSTDGTSGIAGHFVMSDPRFAVRRQENRGLSAARNTGLSMATGDFVQFLDSDDLIGHEKLDRQVRFLDSKPDIDVCYSAYRPFEDRTGRLLPPFWPEIPLTNPLEDFLFRWERGLCIPIHAALFRRAIFPGTEVFDERFRAKEDWIFWVRLALENRRFEFIPDELAYYRLHDRNQHRETMMNVIFLDAARMLSAEIPAPLQARFLASSLEHSLPRLRAAVETTTTAPSRVTPESAGDNVVSAIPAVAGNESEGAARLTACTIIAPNYTSQARALSESFLRHEPEGAFFVLMMGGAAIPGEFDPRVRVLSPAELPIPHLREMELRYDLVELCTAVKPWLLLHLLSTGNANCVIYFDPDIQLFQPLRGLEKALEDSAILLTPHFIEPMPLDGFMPSEQQILATGVYNLGFIAVRRDDSTSRFLKWWGERTRFGSHQDPARGEFFDQKWIDAVPVLFPHVHILRDETCNVAYWNLHSRALTRLGDDFFVNGKPLTFFHFSGVDVLGCRFRPASATRFDVRPGSALHDLLTRYRDRLLANGYEESRSRDYDLTRLTNGAHFHPLLREMFLALPIERQSEFGDPRDSEGHGSFFEWATRADPGTGLSPFLWALYERREDVRAAYPDVLDKDREGFLEWARTSGAKEFGYDPQKMCPSRG